MHKTSSWFASDADRTRLNLGFASDANCTGLDLGSPRMLIAQDLLLVSPRMLIAQDFSSFFYSFFIFFTYLDLPLSAILVEI